MKRLIVLTGSFAMVVACSNPSASAGNNLASSSESATPAAVKPVAAESLAAKPVATSGADTTAAVIAPVAVREVTIPAGTVLPVDLETAVGSDISRVEQPVHARLRRALTINGVEVLAAGTAVNGHVTAAERPGKVKGRGYVAMRFTEVDTPGAGTTRISSSTISRTAPATKQKDAVKILGPAAGGAVLGGAAGTGWVLSTRGKEVRVGKGADLSVKLTAPVTVRIAS